jgi:hypothetical protein
MSQPSTASRPSTANNPSFTSGVDFNLGAPPPGRNRAGSNSTRNSHGRAPSHASKKSVDDMARQKDPKDKDRKAMLSRALQKAHTAVLLDNAQNYEGAIEAYSDACDLLQQVLVRSTADEERRKLEQIVSIFHSISLAHANLSRYSVRHISTVYMSCINSTHPYLNRKRNPPNPSLPGL